MSEPDSFTTHASRFGDLRLPPGQRSRFRAGPKHSIKASRALSSHPHPTPHPTSHLVVSPAAARLAARLALHTLHCLRHTNTSFAQPLIHSALFTMLYSTLIVATTAFAGFAAAQNATSDLPTGFPTCCTPQTAPNSTVKEEWCNANQNTCVDLCGTQGDIAAKGNDCDDVSASAAHWYAHVANTPL